MALEQFFTQLMKGNIKLAVYLALAFILVSVVLHFFQRLVDYGFFKFTDEKMYA